MTSLKAASVLTASDAASTIANFSSLTSLSIDYATVTSALDSAGMKLSDVFGSDYSGVTAILAAGASDATKLTAIVTAINDAFANDNSNISTAGFRRAVGDASLDAQIDIALLQSVVGFAESVAAPDSDFAQEVGSASGAWDKISADGLGATLQGIESKTVEASDAGFDPTTVVADAAEQITATSAFIVSELIEDSPVTEKNAEGAIDYSNHLNGAVAQKLALDEFFSENADKSLSDLIGATAAASDAAGEATLISTVTATAAAVSDVSKDLATASPGTAFDFEVAEEVAAAVFTKVEDVRGTGATKAAFATAFDPTAGAGAALAIYDKAEEIKTANPGVTLESVFSENAGVSAVDAIYEVAADDSITFNADSGVAVLDAFYEMAAEIETEIIAGGGKVADFSTQFKADAGLNVAHAIFNTVEDVRGT